MLSKKAVSIPSLINHQSTGSVSNFPSCVEYQTGTVLQKIIIYFIRCVSRAVIICMGTVKIENDRNIVLCKIVVIASVIKTVRVVLIIVGVIKFNIGVL